MDDAQAWLAAHADSPWAYVLLFLASLIEYVFPPFPGDSVALLGVVLATSAGMNAALTYVALNVGATVGGLFAYGIGRRYADPASRPAFLRHPRIAKGIEEVEAQIAKHGSLILLGNRFVPALRALFFVGAGVARVPVWKVVVLGGLSAALWNALLFGLGALAGANLERLTRWVQQYSLVAVVGLVALLILWLVRARFRAAPSGSDGSGPDGAKH